MSNNSIRVEERVEVERFAMTIDAGQGAQDIVGVLSFDRSKGTAKISVHITTKHINLNDDENRQIVLDDFRLVGEKAMYAAIPKIKEYLESQNPNPGQKSLFSEEQPVEADVVPTGPTAKKKKKKEPDSEPESDGLENV